MADNINNNGNDLNDMEDDINYNDIDLNAIADDVNRWYLEVPPVDREAAAPGAANLSGRIILVLQVVTWMVMVIMVTMVMMMVW